MRGVRLAAYNAAILLVAALVVAAAMTADAPKAQTGTYDFRNLNTLGDWTIQAPQWNAAFSVTRGHPPRTDGKRLRDQTSALFRLQSGWTYTDGTPRAELYSIPQTPRPGQPALPTYIEDGEEWCFGWSEYLPAAFPASTSTLWHVLAQWQGRQGGSPPLTLVHEGSLDRLKLKNNRTGHVYWQAPMGQFRGRWTDFVVRVDFDRTPADAAVDLWVNDTHVADSDGEDFTMRPDQDGKSYPKVGLYTADRPEPREAWVNGYRGAGDCELADPQGPHP